MSGGPARRTTGRTAARSAGILLHRGSLPQFEVWIGHMGGPFWARKDARAWSIPKGEYLDDEEPLAAALREFAEEIGVAAPPADYRLLGEFSYSSGKRITIFAAPAPAFDVAEIRSETFELEWPPRSGRMQSFPELDRAGWVAADVARDLLVAGQVPAIDALEALLAS